MSSNRSERDTINSEEEQLLYKNETWMEMADREHEMGNESQRSHSDGGYTDTDPGSVEPTRTRSTADGDEVALANSQPVEYRVYKIRWFGLTQLILLNIIVSWDVSRISRL